MNGKRCEMTSNRLKMRKRVMSQESLPALSLLLLLLFSGACKKSDSNSTAPSTAPAVSATPTPAFSAAQKIGMFAYARNNQSNDQQLRDEYDCYSQVQQQTAINPEAAVPSGLRCGDAGRAAAGRCKRSSSAGRPSARSSKRCCQRGSHWRYRR